MSGLRLDDRAARAGALCARAPSGRAVRSERNAAGGADPGVSNDPQGAWHIAWLRQRGQSMVVILQRRSHVASNLCRPGTEPNNLIAIPDSAFGLFRHQSRLRPGLIAAFCNPQRVSAGACSAKGYVQSVCRVAIANDCGIHEGAIPNRHACAICSWRSRGRITDLRSDRILGEADTNHR